MKLKSNQTRTYDGDGYKKRAACLCFRSESEEEVRAGPGRAGLSCGRQCPGAAPSRAGARCGCVRSTLGKLGLSPAPTPLFLSFFSFFFPPFFAEREENASELRLRDGGAAR